jgi:hypothetical protein
MGLADVPARIDEPGHPQGTRSAITFNNNRLHETIRGKRGADSRSRTREALDASLPLVSLDIKRRPSRMVVTPR